MGVVFGDKRIWWSMVWARGKEVGSWKISWNSWMRVCRGGEMGEGLGEGGFAVFG